MKYRLLVPAILSTVLLATPVLAATSQKAVDANQATKGLDTSATHKPAHMFDDKSAECMDMQQQFDSALPAHYQAKKVDQARTLRTEGSKLCHKGEYADGIAKLELALNDLGVTRDR